MKLAIVNQPFGSKTTSSIDIWSDQMARRLTSVYEVTVYRPGNRFFKIETKIEKGAAYVYIPVGLRKGLNLIHSAIQHLHKMLPERWRESRRPRFSHILAFLGYSLLLAIDARRRGCDIIHIHNFSQFVPVVRSLNPDVRIILHMHCEWLTQLERNLVKKRLRDIDLVLGCADYVTNKIKEAFPEYADKCRTVFNGVNTDILSKQFTRQPSRDENIHRLLYVGRLSPEKGIHVLLEAFNRLKPDFPNLRLTLIGTMKTLPDEFFISLTDNSREGGLLPYFSEDYDAVLHDLASRSLPGDVEFLGPVCHEKLSAHYAEADVFVFPSVWNEPFGMPPLEAMAAGVPVVATAVGGIVETVVHGETGILVQPNDTEALATAIKCLLLDQSKRRRMGAAGIERAKYFSWKRIRKQLQQAYESLYSIGAKSKHLA